MRTIRNNTFETNSSSTHSITVPRKIVADNLPITAISIVVGIGEFGWEYETYNTPQDILSYLFTAICSNYKQDWRKYTLIIDDVLARYNVNIKITWEEPKFDITYDEYGNIKYYYLDNGYIDHGYELMGWLDDIFNDEELLVQTILFGVIETGNDNDCWEDECYSSTTAFDDTTTYFYYKGN